MMNRAMQKISFGAADAGQDGPRDQYCCSVAMSLEQGMTTATRWPNDRRHNMTTLLRLPRLGLVRREASDFRWRCGSARQRKTTQQGKHRTLGLRTSNYRLTSAVTFAPPTPTFHITFFGCGSASAWTLDFCDSLYESV